MWHLKQCVSCFLPFFSYLLFKTHLFQPWSRTFPITKTVKHELPSLVERITSLAEEIQGIQFNRKENNSALIQLHTSAVKLWNLAVAMKTGGTVDSSSNARRKYYFEAEDSLHYMCPCLKSDPLVPQLRPVKKDSFWKLWFVIYTLYFIDHGEEQSDDGFSML